jgi:hypothetical protein
MFNYHTIISPLDQFEIRNLFSLDDFSYLMYLPSDDSFNGVVAHLDILSYVYLGIRLKSNDN